MHAKKINYDLSTCLFRTAMMRDILNGYKRIVEDPDYHDRIINQECQVCYYGSRVGGSSMTITECGICNKEMTFGNTDVDVLCIDCAMNKRVCKHCGADMEYKNRRKL